MKTKKEIQQKLTDNNIYFTIQSLNKNSIQLSIDDEVTFHDLKKLSIIFETEEITVKGRGGDGSDDGWYLSWSSTDIEIINPVL